MNDFMTQATRRRLLAGIRVLAMGRILAPSTQGPDTSLLDTCLDFAELESAKLRFFYGSSRIDDDDEREDRIAPLLAAQVERLGLICKSPAVTTAGLRAKASTWQLWDGGELFQRATRHGLLEDRLLVSLLQDVDVAR